MIKVEHKNHGTINKNSVTISTQKGNVTLYFSYETLVGVNDCISENQWSNTTSKFLNELQPDKDKRQKHEFVLNEAKISLQYILNELQHED